MAEVLLAIKLWLSFSIYDLHWKARFEKVLHECVSHFSHEITEVSKSIDPKQNFMPIFKRNFYAIC